MLQAALQRAARCRSTRQERRACPGPDFGLDHSRSDLSFVTLPACECFVVFGEFIWRESRTPSRTRSGTENPWTRLRGSDELGTAVVVPSPPGSALESLSAQAPSKSAITSSVEAAAAGRSDSCRRSSACSRSTRDSRPRGYRRARLEPILMVLIGCHPAHLSSSMTKATFAWQVWTHGSGEDPRRTRVRSATQRQQGARGDAVSSPRLSAGSCRLPRAITSPG